MEIHENAPVVARSQVQIAADPESVWELLTDLEKWPTWKTDVRSMALHGALKPGSIFVWKAGPGTIRSTLQEVDPPRVIGWTGSTFGVKAIDVFRFEPRIVEPLEQGEVRTEFFSGLRHEALIGVRRSLLYVNDRHLNVMERE